MGKAPVARWYEILNQERAEEADGDEIAEEIIRKLGLVVK